MEEKQSLVRQNCTGLPSQPRQLWVTQLVDGSSSPCSLAMIWGKPFLPRWGQRQVVISEPRGYPLLARQARATLSLWKTLGAALPSPSLEGGQQGQGPSKGEHEAGKQKKKRLQLVKLSSVM